MIGYRGIVHEVIEDAPFIGAIIVAPTCTFCCSDCQNKHLMNEPLLYASANEILNDVQSNPINEGIILSGLEWTLSYPSMIELTDEALSRNMKVMLYTGMYEDLFAKIFPQMLEKPIWIKFGAYLPMFASSTHESYGIKLASTNQYVKWFGKEDMVK